VLVTADDDDGEPVGDDAAAGGGRRKTSLPPLLATAKKLPRGSPALSVPEAAWIDAAAVDAASRVVAVRRGRPPRIASLLSSPAVVGVVFAGAALVDRVGLLPMSLQTYLHVHFEKTLAQSRQLLAGFIDEGVAAGIDIAALRALQEMQSRCEPSGAQEGA
jgi:hypothetical protein